MEVSWCVKPSTQSPILSALLSNDSPMARVSNCVTACSAELSEWLRSRNQSPPLSQLGNKLIYYINPLSIRGVTAATMTLSKSSCLDSQDCKSKNAEKRDGLLSQGWKNPFPSVALIVWVILKWFYPKTLGHRLTTYVRKYFFEPKDER